TVFDEILIDGDNASIVGWDLNVDGELIAIDEGNPGGRRTAEIIIPPVSINLGAILVNDLAVANGDTASFIAAMDFDSFGRLIAIDHSLVGASGEARLISVNLTDPTNGTVPILTSRGVSSELVGYSADGSDTFYSIYDDAQGLLNNTLVRSDFSNAFDQVPTTLLPSSDLGLHLDDVRALVETTATG